MKAVRLDQTNPLENSFKLRTTESYLHYRRFVLEIENFFFRHHFIMEKKSNATKQFSNSKKIPETDKKSQIPTDKKFSFHFLRDAASNHVFSLGLENYAATATNFFKKV